MSITLCGFATSNYFNKVKLALLEKQIPFTEELAIPSQDAGFLEVSARLPFGRYTTRTGSLTFRVSRITSR